jgi:hypothetical protein
MAKDDYIKIRCSSEFKRMVENKAKEKDMNLTEYIENLVIKDGSNMMYVYSIDELEADNFNKILNSGFAVRLGDECLLSRSDKIAIGTELFESYDTLENYIECMDGGESIELVKGLEVTQEEVIESLIGELEQPCDDNGNTYIDRIYNADDSYKEIKKLIDEFLMINIDFKLTDIKCSIQYLQKQMKNGENVWE